MLLIAVLISTPFMSKATFYFVISVLVLTDFVQSRYQKKLMKMKGLNIKS
jgi:hypothetical protein